MTLTGSVGAGRGGCSRGTSRAAHLHLGHGMRLRVTRARVLPVVGLVDLMGRSWGPRSWRP